MNRARPQVDGLTLHGPAGQSASHSTLCETGALSLRPLLGHRILVTGASGFLGSALLPELTGAGAHVTGIARRPFRAASSCEFQHLDLSDRHAVDAAFAHAKPEIVVHLAGHVNGRRDPALLPATFADNVVGTFNVLLAASAHGCKRVLLTSSAGATLPEDLGSTPYGVSKAVMEMYGRTFHALCDLPVLCLRPFLTYGPGQSREKLIPYSILSFLNGVPPTILSGGKVIDLIYVDDVVSGLLRACIVDPATIAGETIDLGTGRPTLIRDLVMTLARLVDRSRDVVFSSHPTEIRRTEGSLADLAQARALLGWEPRWTLEEGLQQTVRWYAQGA